MNAILSIKPEYVSEIIAGRKRYVTQGQVQCHLDNGVSGVLSEV